MKRITTKGIVLRRVNYQEADRIITMITPDQGIVRVMARGVRKSRSKMAGGIELFSVNEIIFIPGKGDISTLVSTRLVQHFGSIVKDIRRTMFAYEVLKKMAHAVEDAPSEDYFYLLKEILALLDVDVDLVLLDISFVARLLRLEGNAPSLDATPSGDKLPEASAYSFDFDSMAFYPDERGPYSVQHIKLLRSASAWPPERFCNINAPANAISQSQQLLKKISTYN